MKHAIERFGSIHDLLEANRTRGVSPAFAETSYRASQSSDEYDAGWTKTRSYADAEDLLRSGWNEPLDAIRQQVTRADKLDTAQAMTKAQMRYRMRGSSVAVARALSGNPEAMRQIHVEPLKAKTVHIAYGVSASASVSADTLVKCGAAVLAIVNHAERLGVRVRLDVFEAAYAGEDNAGWTLTVKHYKEPLNLLKLAFPLCHPSMLRRVSFRWLETAPIVTNRRFTSGYGYPIHHAGDSDLREFEAQTFPAGTHVIYQKDVERAGMEMEALMRQNGIILDGKRKSA